MSHVGGVRVDQVISLRYPSYAVRHPAHVCWLNHMMREYYDLWPRLTAPISAANRVKEGIRRTLLHAADGWLLTRNITKLVAQSQTIQRRLIDDLGIPSEVLWPPAPQRAYRCERYGDYIFTMSRLNPLKRIDLLVRALAEPAARGVRAVIAGRRRRPRLARGSRGPARRGRPRQLPWPRGRRDNTGSSGAMPGGVVHTLRRRLRVRHRRSLRLAQGGDHVQRQRRAGRARPERRDRPCLRTDASGAGAWRWRG